MNAIKLPAEASHAVGDWWRVRTADKIILCALVTEPQAKQIALALNLHDELFVALRTRMEMANHNWQYCSCEACATLRKANL